MHLKQLFLCMFSELDRTQRLEERERILREIWMNGQPDISTVTQSLNRYYWGKGYKDREGEKKGIKILRLQTDHRWTNWIELSVSTVCTKETLIKQKGLNGPADWNMSWRLCPAVQGNRMMLGLSFPCFYAAHLNHGNKTGRITLLKSGYYLCFP